MSARQPRISLENELIGFIEGSDLQTALVEFSEAAMVADKIDPMITELVRLRCAQVHDCRFCGSLRMESALKMGLDEETAARIAHYETAGLDPAAVAALRLADAIILQPAEADEKLAQELDRHFTPAQIAEICFDVVKWSQQKVAVSLRLEAPPEEPTFLDFDDNGAAVIGPAGGESP